MNPEFIAILKKLVTEQGKEVLFIPTKCKAFLADYTHGEFKKESRLLIQTIEAGVPKAIDTSDELLQCKQQQIRVLREELFLAEEIAEDIIDTFTLILKKTGEQTILSLQNKTTASSEIVEQSSNEIKKHVPSDTVTEDRKGFWFWFWFVIGSILFAGIGEFFFG